MTRPTELADADLIVVPGSRATVADLGWLRGQRFPEALAATDGWIVGICAGYQMLGRRIHDRIESGVGVVDGLGLLEAETWFEEPKIVGRSSGTASGRGGSGPVVAGYQIRFGRPEARGEAWFHLDGADEGLVAPGRAVRGTSLHGLFDRDDFRADFLTEVAEARGRHYEPATLTFAQEVDRYHERLADWVDAALGPTTILDLASTAAPADGAPGW